MTKNMTRNEMIKTSDRMLKEVFDNVSLKEINELIDIANEALGDKEGEQDIEIFKAFLNSIAEYGSKSAESLLKEFTIEDKKNDKVIATDNKATVDAKTIIIDSSNEEEIKEDENSLETIAKRNNTIMSSNKEFNKALKYINATIDNIEGITIAELKKAINKTFSMLNRVDIAKLNSKDAIRFSSILARKGLAYDICENLQKDNARFFIESNLNDEMLKNIFNEETKMAIGVAMLLTENKLTAIYDIDGNPVTLTWNNPQMDEEFGFDC